MTEKKEKRRKRKILFVRAITTICRSIQFLENFLGRMQSMLAFIDNEQISHLSLTQKLIESILPKQSKPVGKQWRHTTSIYWQIRRLLGEERWTMRDAANTHLWCN